MTVADGHNGCDTRDDILSRDLADIVRNGDCTVISGVLRDPYSGTTVEFHRGQGTSSLVPIDHVVALLDAWQKGAQQWDAATLRNFANDPINLQATTRSMNEQKGAGDAATWLPPNKSYRCAYVSRIVEVKTAYGLWVTQAEHDAIARILTSCGAPSADPEPPPTDTAPAYSRHLLHRCPIAGCPSTTQIAERQGTPARRRSMRDSPDIDPGLSATATVWPANNPRDVITQLADATCQAGTLVPK